MAKKTLAIVGATGLIGNAFLRALEIKNLKFDDYVLYASAKSEGKRLSLFGREETVRALSPDAINETATDYALFSAGADVSKKYAPIFVKNGATVIDNSSQWRMNESCPLVVPEVNPQTIAFNKGIIANPNCSTIQAVVTLKPLDDAFGLKRVIITTYQSVSGAGMKGLLDLKNGSNGISPKKFNKPIFDNVIPQIDDFCDNGYTKEEMKLVNETRKILNKPTLSVCATAVRIPLTYCHSESINVEFENDPDVDDVKKVLSEAKGVILTDEKNPNEYPTPVSVKGKTEVFVGRIRRDLFNPNSFAYWVVADNTLKGAAWNAVQILELLV